MNSEHNKVVWSEGMFLKTQHFQQQDRYMERLVRRRIEGVTAFTWGLRSLTINRELLALGKFTVEACEGVFADGTPFDIPEDDRRPAPLEPPATVTDSIVYLCVPLARRGAPEVDVSASLNSGTRFLAEEIDVVDAIAGAHTVAQIRTAKLRLSLKLEHEDRTGYQCLGIARIAAVLPDRRITLDPDYIGPCLNASAAPVLMRYLNEVTALLHHRGQALSPRVTEAASQGVAGIADFLLLQLINRCEPVLVHLRTLPSLHPERLYSTLLELAGELATFSAQHKRPPEFASYRHDDLDDTFRLLMPELRLALNSDVEQAGVSIPLREHNYGVRVGAIADQSLLTSAIFMLVVRANMTGDAIRRSLPSLVKIGPVEQIVELVRAQLPGIRVQPLAIAPRQIPYYAGAVYFELEPDTPLWKQMASSSGIAIYLAGEFPDLFMELWAIRVPAAQPRTG